MNAKPKIDEAGMWAVDALIVQVRSAGLTEAAEVFSNVYWGWLRLTEAYVNAHPYVSNPEAPTMTPISALSVTDFTLNHWAKLIPGSPDCPPIGYPTDITRCSPCPRRADGGRTP